MKSKSGVLYFGMWIMLKRVTRKLLKKSADQLQCCVSHEKIRHHMTAQLCKDMALLNP